MKLSLRRGGWSLYGHGCCAFSYCHWEHASSRTRSAEHPTSKIQHPEKHHTNVANIQHPRSKIQRRSKFQVPTATNGNWILDLLWILDVGSSLVTPPLLLCAAPKIPAPSLPNPRGAGGPGPRRTRRRRASSSPNAASMPRSRFGPPSHPPPP